MPAPAQMLKGIPIHAKLQLEDCKASVRKVKTETSIGKRAYRGTTQPKKRQKARKSAGMVKKHTPIQQNSGATSDDAIVLSDDDEGATEPPEQEEATSTRDKGAGILDDYFYCSSNENYEVALLQLSPDEYESAPKAVETSSTVQDTDADRSPGDFSSEPNSSDEELLTSYLEFKNKDSTSVEPSEHNCVSQIKTEKTDFNAAYSTSLKDVIQEGGDVMDYDNESDDFALLETRPLASRGKTRPLSGVQRETVSNSSGKADLYSDSDEEPLSSAAARWASKSTNVETSTSVVASKVKNEEIVSESRAASFDQVINTTSRDTSTHKADFPQIETEVECNNSVFAEANMRTHELDYTMDRNSEGENYEMEIQTVKPEPAEEGEDRLSLSSISKQLENEHFMDDGINLWDDYYGYSKLIVNSQENALARVEEDLDDLYSTQIENLEENDTTVSSPCANDTAVPDEALPNAKPQKRVTFADEPSPTDTVTSPRPSVSQPAITKPTRALSEDEFFHKILNWNAERLVRLHSNRRPAALPGGDFPVDRVPNCFDSMDHYYKTFKPLLLMEIWEQAIGSWRDKHLNRKRVEMNGLDGSNFNSFWLIRCCGVINENQQRNAFFPMESDLVLLTPDATDGRGGSSEQSYSGQSVFGFVEKAECKPVQSLRRVSVGSSGGDDEPSEVKFQLTLEIKTSCNFRPVSNCRIKVEFVTSLLTALRQWSGLMHFSKSILACDILRPRKADYFCSVDYSQSSHVAKEYNESQEKIISTAANAVHKPFPIPRICLVQGPPGTGKSFTIVGLVKEILNRAQEMPAQTTPGPSNGSLANKVRILLCGPSNAAIDELIGRIREAQIQLDKRHDNKENRRHNRQNAVKAAFSNNCGDLCLVRVGRKSHIHPSVTKFSLDNMTKQILEKASTSTTEDNLNSIKEKLQNTAANEKKLQREIWMLQTSSHSNTRELEKLETEKANLIKLKSALEQQCRREKDKKANKRRAESRIRKEILQCADVICTTLSGAGSGSLKQDLAGRRVCPFTCVIVDEACQCNELDLLIPLGFQASKLVLVGDPEQLPSTVLSMKAKEKLYGRSMFERLYRFFRHHKEEMGKPVLMLEEQYRMHPEIAAFPSSHVYNNCLKSHSSVEKRPFPLAKHYALFDVLRGGEISQDRGALWNPAEVDLIVKLCRDLTKILHAESVGIITPYRQQKGKIQSRLMDEGLSRGDATIEVNTVDGFQGREKDVIILSCVRAQNYLGSIGFLSDRQRMNVALTRARHALYVFGHMETLKGGSPDWKALVDDAEERHCLFAVESSQKVRSVLSIGLCNDIQSPAKDPRLKTKHISVQVRDSHGNSSSGNDYGVHQMDTPLEVSCSGSAVERNEGQMQPVSTGGREPSATAERRADTSAAEMARKPLPGKNGQRDGHAAEGGKITANSSHRTRKEQEKDGKEGVRYRDHHQKETREVPRHCPRSNDYPSDPHHHGNRDSKKRDHHYRNHHRRDQNNGAPSESKSNHTQRERSRYHSSHRDSDRYRDRDYDHRDRDYDHRDRDYDHRDRDYDHRDRDYDHRDRYRDRDRDHDRDRGRVERSAFQGRQMEPGQNNQTPDTRFSSTTTTSLEENEVSNENEIHCNNGLEIGTQDPHFISLIENNATHKAEYFVKLRQQERQQFRKSAASPAENGWSPAEPEWSPAEHEFTPAEIEFPPAETTASPNETTVTRVPNPGVQPGVATTISNPGVQYRGVTTVTSVPNPGVQPRGETTVSRVPNPGVQPRFERTVGEASNPGVSDTPNPLPTRITQHRFSGYSSAAPQSSSTSNATHSNAISRRPSGAVASSFSTSSGSDTSQPSTSFGGSRSLDRRGESRGGDLDPGAQRALDVVRRRYPPVKGPPVIPAENAWNLYGGSRKRKAHADTGDVSSLRQRASSVSSSSAKRPAVGPPRKTFQEKRKKFQENFRGRKSWK